MVHMWSVRSIVVILQYLLASKLRTATSSCPAQQPACELADLRAIMWNDEDNNPYGTSFDRRDSQTSSSANPASPISRDCECPPAPPVPPMRRTRLTCRTVDRSLDAPHTPTSGSDDELPQPPYAQEPGAGHDTEEVVAEEDVRPKRKPGGYNSRIEQILYENPEMPIMITDAGKSLESGGRYIVYTIRTGVRRPLTYRRLSLTSAL